MRDTVTEMKHNETMLFAGFEETENYSSEKMVISPLYFDIQMECTAQRTSQPYQGEYHAY